MNGRRFSSLLLLSTLLVAALLFSGCAPAAGPEEAAPAGEEEEAAPAEEEEEAAPEEAAAGPPEKIVLGVDSGADSEVLHTFIPRIEEELNIEVEIVPYPVDKMYETLLLSLESGAETFDIVGFNPYMAGDFGPYLEPLENAGDLEDLHLDELVPAFQNNYSYWEGKQVAVIYDGDMRMWHGRKDLFEDPEEQAAFEEEYGYDLAPPTSYEQYLDIAEFFTRPEEDLYGTGECTVYFLAPYWFDRYVYKTYAESDGKTYGQFFDENMNPLINGPEGVWALNNFKESLEYMPPELAKEFEWAEVRNQFYAGRLAMAPQWTDLSKTGSDPDVSEVVGQFLFAPIPPGNIAMLADGRVWAIPKASQHKEAAFKVIAWINSPEHHGELVADTGEWALYDPAYMVEYERAEEHFTVLAGADVQQAKDYGAVTLELFEGKSYPDLDIPGTPRYRKVLVRYFQEALTGQITPEEALDQAAAEWDQITDELGRERQIELYRGYIERMVDQGNWSADQFEFLQ